MKLQSEFSREFLKTIIARLHADPSKCRPVRPAPPSLHQCRTADTPVAVALYSCDVVTCGQVCALQVLPGFLLIFSAESGRILYVSDSVSHELGHPVVSCISCFSYPHIHLLGSGVG